MARYWAFLSDPESDSFDTLFARGREVWDGITGIPAQAQLRQARPGDEVLLYHTSPEKRAYGIGRVASEPRPDPTDPAGERGVVDLEPVERFAAPVPLAALKADPVLAGMRFVRMPRCAVTPVTPEEWRAVRALGRRPA